MVNIGQILIKIGTLPGVDGWQCADDNIVLYRKDFVELMMAPGIPCYSATKSINEKWAMLPSCYGLVVQKFPGYMIGHDGEPILDEDGNPRISPTSPPRAYLLSKERAKMIIQDTIPKRIRNNYLSREHYLKTGEVW